MEKSWQLKIKNFIEKLQALDNENKKIILWAIVGVLGIIMGYFWIMGAIKTVQNIEPVNMGMFNNTLPTIPTSGVQNPMQNPIQNIESNNNK